jgi:hypothetical protein
MRVSQDHEVAEAVLKESRTAIDVLTRLVTKLELLVDRVEKELDRRTPGRGGKAGGG